MAGGSTEQRIEKLERQVEKLQQRLTPLENQWVLPPRGLPALEGRVAKLEARAAASEAALEM